MKSPFIQEICAIADRVDGWLGKREGPYLYELARIGSKIGVVVEIGSWKGKSTVWLAKGSAAINGGRIYAIDPHVGSPELKMLGYSEADTHGEFLKNIRTAGIESLVHPLIKTSMEALKEWSFPIGLLWIDGDHNYESVRSDFFGWEPFVVDEGIIAFHDTYSWEGVRRVVDEEVLRNERFKVLGQVDGILAVKKVHFLSFFDRLHRALIFHLRQIYNKARIERRHWRALPRKLLRALSTPRIKAPLR